MSISVVIPSIPPRRELLKRALASVGTQYLAPDEVVVELDNGRGGAAKTRQAGLERAESEWVAFLDDDDEFRPGHLRSLAEAAESSGADLVYPWFDVVGGTDPLLIAGETPFGRPFDAAAADEILHRNNFIPVTVLARREAVLDAGGFLATEEHEDWGLWRRMLLAGTTFHHLPERTWLWHHHGHNTSGLPTRW